MSRITSTRPIVAFLAASALFAAACTPPLAQAPTSAPAKPAEQKPAVAPATTAPTSKPADSAAAKPAEAKPAAAADPLEAVTTKYYEAAKREGKLVIYGASGPELFNPVRDAFSKRYPGIELQGVDQRGRETREKIFAEQQSRNYVADVAISGFTTQTELNEGGFLETFLSEQISEMRPELVAPGGVFNPRTATMFSMAVNTTAVPAGQEPKEWKDVLDPKYRGKLAMDDPRGSGPGGTVLGGLEQLYGQEFSEKLAAQNVFFATTAGPMLTGVSRGEYHIFLSANHAEIVKLRQSGAPVKYVKPVDGVGLTPISQSLVKNAPHPNAARLWIEWNMSAEGQAVLSAQGYASVRKGVKAVEPEAELEGVKILPTDNSPDAEKYLGDVNARTKRWESIFFK